MNFFFDDSGDFSLPKNTENKISLWMGVVIPETSSERIRNNYLAWEGSEKTRLKAVELKGSILDERSRRLFFDLIENENDLLVQPGIVDLQIQKKYAPIDLPAVMRKLGIGASKRMKSREAQGVLDLHGRRLGNLSAEQLMKFMVLSFCIIETFRHSIMFRSHDDLRECWNDIFIVIDRSSRKNNSREEISFKESMGWALHNITRRKPLELVEEIHDRNHPFVKNYDSVHGIDGRKLFRNLHFDDSTNRWELRLTDIIANTMFRVLNDLENKFGMLQYYKKIMKQCPLGPKSNLGFTCIVGSDEVNDRITSSKYAILQRILDSNSAS